MEKTAVQWLIDNLEKFEACKDISWRCYVEIHEALRMEREQIVTAYNKSVPFKFGNQYYSETYQSNESVNHIGDANQMVDDLQTVSTEILNQKVQKLIDKDIFEQATVAMEEVYGSKCETEIDAYFRGAKWILKQFKK